MSIFNRLDGFLAKIGGDKNVNITPANKIEFLLNQIAENEGGDNVPESLELSELIMTAPNGTSYKVGVDNNGELTIEAVSE